MTGEKILRGGDVHRPGSRRQLVADMDESEITVPSPELIAAIKAHDHRRIDELTRPTP